MAPASVVVDPEENPMEIVYVALGLMYAAHKLALALKKEKKIVDAIFEEEL